MIMFYNDYTIVIKSYKRAWMPGVLMSLAFSLPLKAAKSFARHAVMSADLPRFYNDPMIIK